MLAFTTIALIVLVIFSVVAYRIAVESTYTQKLVLMQSYVENKAMSLRNKYSVKPSASEIVTALIKDSDIDYLYFLFDSDGKLIQSHPVADFLGEKLEMSRLTGEKTQIRSGRLSFDGQDYVWSSTRLPDTTFTLVALQSDGVNSTPIYQTIGVRLLVTGGIVIWVSIWGALVLSGIISKRMNAQDSILRHQATHDALTGLPNRALLYDRLQQAIYYSRRDGNPFALMVADLNGFKEINDTLGHQSGDHLLQQVGPRLKTVLRESDTIARLGGDEFGILLLSASVDDASRYALRLTEILEDPFALNKLNIQVGAGIGIALYPDHGQDPDTLVRHADVAMYQAKHNNRDFTLYAPDSDPHSVHRLTLMSELRESIERNELVLHYQPIMRFSDRRVFGVEALARWQHPKHGLIYPDDFIPLTEQTGLVKPLTHWVIREALHQCEHWHRRGIDLNMAINLSVRILHDRRLPELVGELLDETGLPPASIMFEITESAVMADPESVMATLHGLNSLGCQLAIDDFGTGFTSLAYLKKLPVNELKIDRTFVMGMIQDDNDAVLVRAIIDLAHNMGRRVVAEGVETLDIQNILEILGCDFAQGNYLSRPIPAHEFERWLSQSNLKPISNSNVTPLPTRRRHLRSQNMVIKPA
jgi:diguanylate cyclase (GGDEF)-like protein